MITSARTRVFMQSPFFILDASLSEALKAAALSGVSKFTARVKCAMLAWVALEESLLAANGYAIDSSSGLPMCTGAPWTAG